MHDTLFRLRVAAVATCALLVSEAGGFAPQRHLDGSTLSTAIAGSLVPAHSFTRTYTPAGEPTGWTLSAGGVQRVYSVSRNGAGRVTSLSDAGLAAAYAPAAVGPGVGQVDLGAIRAEYGWGAGGTQLTNLVWKTSSGTPLVGFTQIYDEEEPTRVVRRAGLDGSTWHYLYDEHGRLIEAALRDGDGQLLPGGLYRYRYDQAGNPVTGGPVEGGNPLWAFEHAGHLQVRRLWGNRVEVLGEAAADAAVGVSVDGGPLVRAEKSGTRFRCVVEVPALAAGAKDVRLEVIAARQEGPNAIVQRTRGRLYLPKADEAVTRDAAGQLRLDSRWEYTWNLRGQLLRAESKHRNPNVRLDYFYYPSGPMMRREKREWLGGEWRLVSTTTWTVDGWRPVNEIETREGGDTIERLYTWGLDLAGWRDRRSLDTAGGIGGLLAVRERVNGGTWTTYYVLSDPQGNVVGLVSADGTLVAQYDYDPYGRLIRETGPKAASCPFRYSTKWYDPDLGLFYYGYRWYDAASLKWLTPDPIGERGGVNMTAFCDGDPINQVDPLGLATMEFDLDYDPSTDQVLVVLRRCPWWKAQMNLSNWTDVPDTRRWRPATARESAHWRRVKSGDVVGARLTALSEARLEEGYQEMLRYQGALAASAAVGPAVAGKSLLVKSFVASSAYATAYEVGGILTGDVSAERYAQTVAIGTTSGVVIGGAVKLAGTIVSEVKRMPLQATLRDCRVEPWNACVSLPAEKIRSHAVPRAGATIYRVFGGESPGLGRSWSTVSPDAVSDFRASAGLFPGNTGQYVIEARLRSLENASVRMALPGPTTPPNALQIPEILFKRPPIPGVDIDIISVSGANPGF